MHVRALCNDMLVPLGLPRGHQCSHKSDDALRHWPRIADLLLARVVADGWRLGSTRVCQRHSAPWPGTFGPGFAVGGARCDFHRM